MKPRNRVYCRELGRTKLLFETEKKAETFIKFNGNAIQEESGVKPERAYYCVCCGGWHTTSMKRIPKLEGRIQKTIDAYNRMKNC